MIEVFTPYLLIFLLWNDLDPEETMSVSQDLFISEEVCMAAGAERMQIIESNRLLRLEKFKAEQIKTEAAKFVCVPQLHDIGKYRPLLDEN
jgi:hypothetical protein